MNKLEKFAEVANSAQEAEVVWLRQTLTVAAGALALLAGLGPKIPPGGLAQVLLAATWVLLGIGIVTGSAATYLAVSRAKSIANKFRMEIEKGASGVSEWIGPAEIAWIHDHSRVNPVLRVCKPLMVFSLLAAVSCLTVYAMMITLAA